MTRVRGQQLEMVIVGGSGRRRDHHGLREVIAASEVAEASWIWTTKMNASKGDGKREDGSVFWWQGPLLR